MAGASIKSSADSVEKLAQTWPVLSKSDRIEDEFIGPSGIGSRLQHGSAALRHRQGPRIGSEAIRSSPRLGPQKLPRCAALHGARHFLSLWSSGRESRDTRPANSFLGCYLRRGVHNVARKRSISKLPRRRLMRGDLETQHRQRELPQGVSCEMIDREKSSALVQDFSTRAQREPRG